MFLVVVDAVLDDGLDGVVLDYVVVCGIGLVILLHVSIFLMVLFLLLVVHLNRWVVAFCQTMMVVVLIGLLYVLRVVLGSAWMFLIDGRGLGR